MSSIKVDPGQLGGTAAHIERSIQIANDVRSKHSAMQCEAGAAGRGDVEDSITSFMSTWSYGLECVNKDGETLSKFLKLAADAYDKAELQIATAAGGGG
jgi:hypothetical protein